jgi:hypothetical protein
VHLNSTERSNRTSNLAKRASKDFQQQRTKENRTSIQSQRQEKAIASSTSKQIRRKVNHLRRRTTTIEALQRSTAPVGGERKRKRKQSLTRSLDHSHPLTFSLTRHVAAVFCGQAAVEEVRGVRQGWRRLQALRRVSVGVLLQLRVPVDVLGWAQSCVQADPAVTNQRGEGERRQRRGRHGV